MFPRIPLVLVALTLLGSRPGGASDLPEIPFEFYTLENGLEVILHEDHSTPIVGVNIWYHVGSGNEVAGRTGFAHLFEHMMFQGSAHQDAEYFGPLHEIGALINGSTSEDRTNYWEIVPANHLERALLMQADRMGWLLPAMTQEKLDNQIEVVRNERRESEGQPYAPFWLTLNEHFYPKGHPYDHSVIGIHEDLEAATLDDVKDFFRKYYTPNNATLSIAGDFDPEQTKAWIERYFGEIPPGPPVERIGVWIPELTKEKRVIMQDRVQLTRLYYCWHTPPYYAEGDADMDLVSMILGQGRTSRLYQRLVHEEELVQDVRSSQGSQQASSMFYVRLTLKPGADPAEVERILEEELARFGEEGPTREELQLAKDGFEARFVRGVQRIGSWGGKNDRLNRYNHYVGTPDYFRQDYDRYMSRTQDTVQDTFNEWIGPGRLVMVIEPLAEMAAAPASSVDRSVLPEGGPEPELVVPEIAHTELANGLKLAVMRHDELPLVQMNLVFHSGTAADPADREGLATLTTAMHLEGTKSRDKFEMEDELDAMGTQLYHGLMDDYAAFHLSTLVKHLEPSLELLAEVVLEPAMGESEFEKEKERRLIEIRREGESPYAILGKAARRTLYGDGHPYARMGMGTEESMSAMTLSDVNEFAAKHFVPGNATLVAVGDVSLEDLKMRVERAFGDWTGSAPAAGGIPEPHAITGRTVYLVDKPGDTQSTISIGHMGIARSDPDWEALAVVNRLFGGFFSSRLNLNLREDKGYTYGVRSQVFPKLGKSAFTMGGRVQTDATAASITEFLNEFEQILSARPITEEELEFAKSNIVRGYPQDLETVSQLADVVTEQIVYGLPDDDLARYPERISAVDLETAEATARKYFHPDDVGIVVVGDLSKIEESIVSLDLGPIVYLDREGRVIEPTAEYSSQ